MPRRWRGSHVRADGLATAACVGVPVFPGPRRSRRIQACVQGDLQAVAFFPPDGPRSRVFASKIAPQAKGQPAVSSRANRAAGNWFPRQKAGKGRTMCRPATDRFRGRDNEDPASCLKLTGHLELSLFRDLSFPKLLAPFKQRSSARLVPGYDNFFWHLRGGLSRWRIGTNLFRWFPENRPPEYGRTEPFSSHWFRDEARGS